MGALIDHERSMCLCSEGAPGYAACVLIAEDGREDFVLVHQELIGYGGYNPATPDAPHEQPGPLPFEYAQRIAALDRRRGYRCGRRTRSGTVCRMRVTRPGDACEWHRGTP